MVNELKLIAVGSSTLIAEEIKTEVLSLVGEGIPIEMLTTDEVHAVAPNEFYVCALTQEIVLEKVVPREQLFVLDLRPTTKFFLDIAKIPRGELVCIFNNRLPYIQLLIEECRQLGIDQLQFEAVAYDDMPSSVVWDRLSAARYVVGVACLMDERMLFSDRFRNSLRADVKTIAGRRSASIKSAGRLLAGISGYYLDRRSGTVGSVVKLLRRASNNAVLNRIGLRSSVLEESPSDADDVDSQREVLRYLHEKFCRLAERN